MSRAAFGRRTESEACTPAKLQMSKQAERWIASRLGGLAQQAPASRGSLISDEPSLAFLQELVQRVLDGQKNMTREIRALTHRVGNLETGFGLMQSQIAEMSGRLIM